MAFNKKREPVGDAGLSIYSLLGDDSLNEEVLVAPSDSRALILREMYPFSTDIPRTLPHIS
jgi:hypothetical protein